MIVTTARNQESLEQEAKRIAADLQLPYVPRRNHSIASLCRLHGTEFLLLVTQEGLKCAFCDGGLPFFFHPNSAMLRVRRLMRGQPDPLIEATELKEGNTILDCTLGLASDAIVASYVVGQEGKVMGVESVPILAYMVKHGLQTVETNNQAVNEAMRRIEVISDDHLSFLKKCADNQFDVVYFDPMFEKTVHQSSGIAPLKRLANYDPISQETVAEAKRVAVRRVILKDSRNSSRFEKLGFKPIIRPNASHWFGYIDLEGK